MATFTSAEFFLGLTIPELVEISEEVIKASEDNGKQ